MNRVTPTDLLDLAYRILEKMGFMVFKILGASQKNSDS